MTAPWLLARSTDASQIHKGSSEIQCFVKRGLDSPFQQQEDAPARGRCAALTSTVSG